MKPVEECWAGWRRAGPPPVPSSGGRTRPLPRFWLLPAPRHPPGAKSLPRPPRGTLGPCVGTAGGLGRPDPACSHPTPRPGELSRLGRFTAPPAPRHHQGKNGQKKPQISNPPFPTRLHRAAPVRLQPPGSLPRGRFATASLPIFSGWDFSQRPHRCSPWRAETLAHACHPSQPTHPFRHFVSTNYSPAHGLGGAHRGQAACLGASHPCRGGLAASPHPHPKKNPSCPRCSFGWGELRPPGAPRGAVG